MVGTARDGAGGIASVIATYAEHGLFARWSILMLDSHVVGTKWEKGMAFLRALVHFIVLLFMRRIGLLHLHTSAGPSFWRKSCFAYLAFLFGRPVILHVHSGQFVSFYEDQCGPWRQRLVRLMLERSARVIALSPTWQARYEEIAPGAHLVCIPNPVVAIHGGARPLRKRVVLFLGKLSREKGIFDLIVAWRRVRESLPDARLVLAGDGDLVAARNQAELMGISDSVVFPGWVSGAGKAALLEEACVCVLPSYFEGLPMSLLEALGAGMPCVACAVGGIPDMLSDGVEGRLVEPGDIPGLAAALVDVMSDEQRYARMSAAAWTRFNAGYSAEVVVPKLEKLYAEFGMVPRQTREMKSRVGQ